MMCDVDTSLPALPLMLTLMMLCVLGRAGGLDSVYQGHTLASGQNRHSSNNALLPGVQLSLHQPGKLSAVAMMNRVEAREELATERHYELYSTLPLLFRQKRSHSSDNSSQLPPFSSTMNHSHPFLPQHMYLCHHPPLTFSQDFTGHAEESCSGHHFEIRHHIISICNLIYAFLFPDQPVIFSTDDVVDYPFSVVNNENYWRVCLPLIRLYYRCEDFDYTTVCWDMGLVFINPHTCPSSHLSGASLYYFTGYVNRYLAEGNYQGLKLFCDGTCRLEIKNVAGVSVTLYSKTHPLIEVESCSHNILPVIDSDENNSYYQTFNMFWSSCYAFCGVEWMDDPIAHGLNPHWSYLSTPCQVVEVLFIVLVGCVAAGGLVGNILVVAVMLAGGHRGQESSTLRTSLAVADLMIAAFVVTPAFYCHLQPFIYPSEHFQTNFSAVHADCDFPIAVFYKSGMPLFQGLVLSAATVVSLLTLTLLSFERLIITTRPLQYNRFFSVPKIFIFIVFTWVDGIFLAIFISYGELGFEAYYENHLKFAIAKTSRTPTGKYIDVIYYTHISVFGLAVLMTILLSIIAIINFLVEEGRVKAEWKSLNMRVMGEVDTVKRQKRSILITQLLMTLLFLLSVLPWGILSVFSASALDLGRVDLFHEYIFLLQYISWWLLLGASAWNPWVYNMRADQFREDASAFMCSLLTLSSQGVPIH